MTGYLAEDDCRLADLAAGPRDGTASLSRWMSRARWTRSRTLPFLLCGRSGVVAGSVSDWDQNVLGGMD
jgi:hypothetical protein